MEGNKNITSLKSSNQTYPNAITDNNTTLTDSVTTILTLLIKYFSTTALDIKLSIRYSKNNFFDLLSPTNSDSFFISLTEL